MSVVGVLAVVLLVGQFARLRSDLAASVWLALVAAAAIGGILLILYRRYRRTRRVVDLLAAEPGKTGEILARYGVLLNRGGWLQVDLEAVGRGMIGCGQAGAVFRIHGGNKLDESAPIEVAFEPMALDESDASFMDMVAGQRSTDLAHDEAATNRDSDWAAVKRRVGRMRAREHGYVFWMRVIFSIFIAIWLIQYLRGQASWTVSLPFMYMLPAPILILMRMKKASPMRENWAVPGGIRSGGSGRSSHVFRRESSVLIWNAQARKVGLVDAVTTRAFTATPAEAEFAIRAWLSPVPGPTDEQLAGLFGGAP